MREGQERPNQRMASIRSELHTALWKGPGDGRPIPREGGRNYHL